MKKKHTDDSTDQFCNELIAAAGAKRGVSFAHRSVSVDDVVYELNRRGYTLIHVSNGYWIAEKTETRI